MITSSHQTAWLRWLASEKRYGQNTLDAYKRDLDDFSGSAPFTETTTKKQVRPAWILL